MPTWIFNNAYQFTGSSVISTTVSGMTEFGYVGSMPASGGGTHLIRYNSQVQIMNAAGSVATITAGLSGQPLFNGAALASGTPWGINQVGQVFQLVGSTWTQKGIFGSPSYGLINAGTTLYTMQTANGQLGTMTYAGVSGTLATPMSFPTVMAGSSGTAFAVGGYNTTSLASGFSVMVADPVNATIFAGATLATSGLSIWQQGVNGAFAETQFLSGAGQNVALAWSNNGNTILGCDPGSGVVRVFSVSFGVPSLTQTLPVSGAAAVAISLDSQQALVCQPSSNQLQALGFTGSVWATSGVVAIGNPKCVVTNSTTTMVVGCGSGLATLTFGLSGWAVTSVTGLGWVPSFIAMDSNGSGIAAVGASGVSGFVYYNGVSGVYTGAASGCVVQSGQILTADPTNNLLRTFGVSGSTIVQKASGALSGITTVGHVGNFLFAGTTTATQQYGWGQPYTLNQTRTSQVSIYDGTFHTVTFGVNHVPMAMAFDTNNNVLVTTLQNELYTVSVTGLVASGSIPQFIGQTQTTPYGWSSLLSVSGFVVATTSMNESIATISGYVP